MTTTTPTTIQPQHDPLEILLDEGNRTCGVLELTPAQAQDVLNTYRYRRQRKLNLRHGTVLTETMVAGGWYPYSQLTFNSDPTTGEVELIDGQHRLVAWANTPEQGGPEDAVMPWSVRVLTGDPHAAYATLDSDGKLRTNTDRAKAMAFEGIHDGKCGIETKIISMAEMLIVGMRPEGTVTVKPSQRGKFAFIQDHLSLFTDYQALLEFVIGRETREQLKKPRAAAVILATMMGDPDAATWWGEALQTGGGIQRWMIETFTNPSTTTVGPAYRARVLATGWNCRKHEKIPNRIEQAKSLAVDGTTFIVRG